MRRICQAVFFIIDFTSAVLAGEPGGNKLNVGESGGATIGALWGYGSREELEAAGADRLIDRPAELMGL